MSENTTVWVAGWHIDWHDYHPSFGVVGVATSQELAEQLLANEMVQEHGGTMLDRQAYPEAFSWLEAIARTCIDESGRNLGRANIEFFVDPCVIATSA
jgi:hypothetical protein